jgi:hypothetical protein
MASLEIPGSDSDGTAEGLSTMTLRERSLAISRVFLGTAPTTVLSEISADELEGLFSSLHSEGLTGGLASLMHNAQECSEEVRGSALTDLKVEVTRNLRWRGELSRLDQRLDAADLDGMVLKGAALIHNGYQKWPGTRFLSDIDLLVHERHLTTVRETLEEDGYASGDGFNFHHPSSHLALDLHTDPIKRAGPAFTFSLDDFWDGSIPLNVDCYSRLRQLGAEDHYLHLVIHVLKHGYSRLTWLLDLAVTRDSFDPDRLLNKARAARSERLLSYTLTLLEELFGLPVPEILQQLPVLNRMERIYLDKVVLRQSPQTQGKLVTAFSIPTWHHHAAYIWSISVPQSRDAGWAQRLKELCSMASEAARSFRRSPGQ